MYLSQTLRRLSNYIPSPSTRRLNVSISHFRRANIRASPRVHHIPRFDVFIKQINNIPKCQANRTYPRWWRMMMMMDQVEIVLLILRSFGFNLSQVCCVFALYMISLCMLFYAVVCVFVCFTHYILYYTWSDFRHQVQHVKTVGFLLWLTSKSSDTFFFFQVQSDTLCAWWWCAWALTRRIESDHHDSLIFTFFVNKTLHHQIIFCCVW